MPRPRSLTIAAIIAIGFGLLTIASGTQALMAMPEGVVPFVLQFNFAAGFAYVAAGIGLWRQAGWAAWFALLITLATAAVFAAFLWHVGQGGAWMDRTMGAMLLRMMVWAGITFVAFRHSWRLP